jgi:hypothetical protein
VRSAFVGREHARYAPPVAQPFPTTRRVLSVLGAVLVAAVAVAVIIGLVQFGRPFLP